MATQGSIQYEPARRNDFLAKAAGNILAHHEGFDGIASPRGLRGGRSHQVGGPSPIRRTA